jgi:serine/threonine protein kinase
MSYENRWLKLDEIGAGGQARVFRVLDLRRVNREELLKTFQDSLKRAEANIGKEAFGIFFDQFRQSLTSMTRIEDPSNIGALKLIRRADDGTLPQKAKDRMAEEIRFLGSHNNPHLLQIKDGNASEGFFVSQFYPGGTLADSNLFIGDPLAAIEAILPLARAVGELHSQGVTHRDIKPENIFMDGPRLVLGDFGIIYYEDEEKLRITSTVENVGSRDWMPPWAYSMRESIVRPSFDVFSIAKVLWWMISGKPVMPLYYFDEGDNNLETAFPDDPRMSLVNTLLADCIVEREHQCLIADANELASRLEDLHARLADGKLFTGKPGFPCIVCGGQYNLHIPEGHYEIRNFGIRPAGNVKFRIMKCGTCGNIQIFDFTSKPEIWRE